MIVYQLSNPGQQGQQGHPHNQGNAVPMDPETLKKLLEAQARTEVAIARQNELKVILDGLQEIRMALNFPAVQSDDDGKSERPPIKPIFTEDNQQKLQVAYLNLWMRYGKCVDQIIQKDYSMELPNGDLLEKFLKQSDNK